MMLSACQNAVSLWIFIVHSVASMLYAMPATGTRRGQPTRALTLVLLYRMVLLAAINVFGAAECMHMLLRALYALENLCSECSQSSHSNLAQLAAFAAYSPTPSIHVTGLYPRLLSMARSLLAQPGSVRGIAT